MHGQNHIKRKVGCTSLFLTYNTLRSDLCLTL